MCMCVRCVLVSHVHVCTVVRTHVCVRRVCGGLPLPPHGAAPGNSEPPTQPGRWPSSLPGERGNTQVPRNSASARPQPSAGCSGLRVRPGHLAVGAPPAAVGKREREAAARPRLGGARTLTPGALSSQSPENTARQSKGSRLRGLAGDTLLFADTWRYLGGQGGWRLPRGLTPEKGWPGSSPSSLAPALSPAPGPWTSWTALPVLLQNEALCPVGAVPGRAPGGRLCLLAPRGSLHVLPAPTFL